MSKSSRKRRGAGRPTPASGGSGLQRGYARGRARDDAVRASLEPLRPGERPTAVTVGAVAAAVLALANFVALVAGLDTGPGTANDGSGGAAIAGSLLVAAVLCALAYGMWKASYGAVLGMQTLLAITIVFCSLGLITATSLWAAVLLVLMIAAAGTLFWFLVKAMARLQMPPRPGARSG
jgi:hypothetical protein